VSADTKTFTFVAAPGTYTLRVTAANFTTKKIGTAKKTVTVQGVTPPNPPQPGPAPSPPQPGTATIPAGRLWLIAVIPDVTKQTPEQGAIRASPELHKLLDSKGNHLRWVDPQTAPAELAPWVQRAVADGLPRAIVLDGEESGSVVKESVSLPATSADAVSLLEKWGGK
jgi:hypothetical protein